MISGVLEGGVALLVAVATAIFIFGQMRENAKRNQEDITAIKTMIREYQEDMKDMITKSMTDMKSMVDENKIHQSEVLNREIEHLKDLININNSELRTDIQRLEAQQGQANHLREKFAIMAASLKSLHRRLDIEPPPLLDLDGAEGR